MRRVFGDLRMGWRQLRKNPGFAAMTVLTLALGIGATTAIFSVLDTVLLKPLPFPHQERLMFVEGREPKLDRPTSLSYPDFFDIRQQQKSFDGIASYMPVTHNLTGSGPARHLEGQVVSADFFRVLGTHPEIGRDFLAEDEKAGGLWVVLSHELWTEQFGGTREIVGRSVQLDGQAFTVLGVMPKGFVFPVQQPAPQFWSSLSEHAVDIGGGTPVLVQRGAHGLELVGRLKPGATIESARAELQVIAKALAKQYPESNKRFDGTTIEPEMEHVIGESKAGLQLLFGSVCFVLLIACANVAGLMLARGTRRSGEMALRSAIGASRWDIAEQVLVESMLLATIGGACGVVLAYELTKGLVALLPTSVPRLGMVSVDGRVLLFALLVTAVTGVLFGVLPAWRMAHASPSLALRQTGRGVSGDRKQNRVQAALVVAQTALGLVLLIGSGLMIRSFVRVMHIDPGFAQENLLTARMDVPYPKEDQVDHFYQELLPKLAAIPGVQAAAAGYPLPLWAEGFRISFDLKDHPLPKGDWPSEALGLVTPGYFSTMRIPLIRGRYFDERDTEKSGRVAIVSQSFAQKFFPGEDPIGKVIETGISDNRTKEGPVQIVGVVGDVRRRSMTKGVTPTYYFPLKQCVATSPPIVLRTSVDPRTLVAQVRDAVAQVDPDVPLYRIQTMGDYFATATATPRFQTVLLTAFAGLALLLAAVGLYAMLSYMVAQRTTEIGVRMALGAERGTVLRLILKKGVGLAAVGLAVGLVAAMGLTRLMQGMLYGVKPFDVLTFVSVIAGLMAVATAASAAPAVRAARLDPMRTLREQ